MQALNHPARAAVALAALAASVAASADVQTYNYDLGPLATTSWLKDIVLPRFDPTLGTLTSVSVFLTGSISTDQKYVNQSPTSPIQMTGTSGAQFKLYGATTAILLAQKNVEITNVVDLASNQVVEFTNLTKSDSFSYTSTSALELAAFSGPGSLLFKASAQGSSNTVASGQWDATYKTRATAFGSVEYTYQAVPEPATMAVLGLGALGVLRRKRGAGK